MESEEQLISLDIFGTLRRRKWVGIIVFALCFAATVTVALILPPSYESTATILIEEPDVPDDLVKATVSNFAAQRLQVIQQRVMTSQNLSAIIDRFGLYQTALQTQPRSQVIDMMRSKIDLEVVSANLLGPAQNSKQAQQQQNAASIAFTLAFDNGNPKMAQQVANRLTDLYLAENAQSRQEQAAGTTEFLATESQKLLADVQALGQKLQDFKSKYSGSLPEQFALNNQILNQAQTALMENQRDLQMAVEKRSFLESQLSQINPYAPMTSQGQPATPQAQLMALELQYVDMTAKYGPGHPDVVRVKKQIDSLKQQLGSSGGTTSAQQQLSQLQDQLSQALQKYGEKHPEVQKLRKQIADLQGEIDKAPSQTVLTAPKGPPDNPVYIQLQTQLGDAQADIRGLQAQTAGLQAKVDDLQKKVLLTPAIEGEYNALNEQYNAAVQRYQTFKDKEADAQVAQNMEQQSKGETFSVIEAPQLPEVPVSPNRKLILAAGFVLSGMLGLALMVGLELLDPRIYQTKHLHAVFAEVPLATVPYITTRSEVRWRWIRRFGIACGFVLAVAGSLVYVNQAVMPLDVAYTAIVQRINP
jgi:uncharacterized protein involved in exopolysaccharide biosynthesis